MYDNCIQVDSEDPTEGSTEDTTTTDDSITGESDQTMECNAGEYM